MISDDPHYAEHMHLSRGSEGQCIVASKRDIDTGAKVHTCQQCKVSITTNPKAYFDVETKREILEFARRHGGAPAHRFPDPDAEMLDRFASRVSHLRALASSHAENGERPPTEATIALAAGVLAFIDCAHLADDFRVYPDADGAVHLCWNRPQTVAGVILQTDAAGNRAIAAYITGINPISTNTWEPDPDNLRTLTLPLFRQIGGWEVGWAIKRGR